MIPLTHYHVLLPYHLQQLEQERRLARRRQGAASARRERRGQTTRAIAGAVVSLVPNRSRDDGDFDLERAA